MKFVTLFATLSAVAKVALASYCGRQCDPNKVPETPLSGPLKLVAVTDNKDSSIRYKVAGTVVIENDCVFTVKGFQLTPKSDGAKWYGASDPNSSEGINLTKEEVSATSTATDLTYNIKDSDLFCHASLLSDVGNGGVIRLMDKNYQLLAFAKIAPGAVASTTTTPAAAKTTTTTKKSTTKAEEKSKTTTKATTKAEEKSKTTTKATTKAEEKAKTTTKAEEKPAASASASQAAEATPSVVEATKAGNDTEPATANPAQASQATTATATGQVVSVVTGTAQKQNTNNTSGALSSFKVPSLALYVALLIIAFVRF